VGSENEEVLIEGLDRVIKPRFYSAAGVKEKTNSPKTEK